jgi:hypothetical protein
MTADLRIPDAGLIWVRRGLTLVAIRDPDAGTTCSNHGCRRDRQDGARYCSDACRAADDYPAVRACWRCCAPITHGPGQYCTPECKQAADSQRVRHRDWSAYERAERAPQSNHGTCPTCGAKPGRKCMSANLRTIGRDHKDRPQP